MIGTNLETGLPFFVTTISSPEAATSSINAKHLALKIEALISFIYDHGHDYGHIISKLNSIAKRNCSEGGKRFKTGGAI